ncbi:MULTISPECIES: hypothetical protein [Streptomyces]|uniref:Uncharacterized protein n=1 Tax=Streptomyces venezuelae TaxID=54571 RepID=A0A5P2AX32_STRVZ|nr:hypothetical protein [Streptomyces venezuelae]QES22088.1 hypothetical protein DEJ46_25745 [Streptomyces venezuelae]
MSEAERRPAYLCGQLHAALRTLESIGARTNRLAETGVLHETAKAPQNKLREHLRLTGEHVVAAVVRGEAHAKAATEVFQGIPTFIPSKGIPSRARDKTDFALFSDGYNEQLSAYKAKYGALFA